MNIHLRRMTARTAWGVCTLWCGLTLEITERMSLTPLPCSTCYDGIKSFILRKCKQTLPFPFQALFLMHLGHPSSLSFSLTINQACINASSHRVLQESFRTLQVDGRDATDASGGCPDTHGAQPLWDVVYSDEYPCIYASERVSTCQERKFRQKILWFRGS